MYPLFHIVPTSSLVTLVSPSVILTSFSVTPTSVGKCHMCKLTNFIYRTGSLNTAQVSVIIVSVLLMAFLSVIVIAQLLFKKKESKEVKLNL